MTVRGSKNRNQVRLLEAIRAKIDKPELRQKYYEALKKAQQRIGKSPIEVLKWLIAFAEGNIEELNIDPLRELGYEVAYFSIFGSTTSGDVYPYRLLMHDRTETRWAQEVASGLTLPNRQELLNLQKEVRLILDQLIETGRAPVRLSKQTLTIRTIPNKRHGWIDVTCLHVQDNFLYQMVPTLTIHAGWVRKCRDVDCTRRFLGKRNMQRFCSVTCQSREATRRYRRKSKKRVKPYTEQSRKETH